MADGIRFRDERSLSRRESARRICPQPEGYDGIRLYSRPSDIHQTRERLKRLGYHVSDVQDRDYGQTEFFLTDDAGFTHCFGGSNRKIVDSTRPLQIIAAAPYGGRIQ
jgi:hypothetical protein